MTARILAANDATWEVAARTLASGGIVACTTDTVFGLHVDPRQEAAVARLRAVKGHTDARPFVILCDGSDTDLDRLAPHRGTLARTLVVRYWPGPLTIVMIGEGAPAWVRSANGGVAVRAPATGAARRVMHAFGHPIVSSSANRAGAPPVETADEAWGEFGDAVDLVVRDDGGAENAPRQSLASTVVDATGDEVVVIRQGAIRLSEGIDRE